MKYKILCEDSKLGLIDRLLKVRGISDDVDLFLNPKCKDYRNDPFKLNDMEKAVDRIIDWLKKWDKIMIFGDYDCDWVTSSFILYEFITKYLHYKNISIMYPDRIEDGYGMKNKHIDMMKEKWVDLIITVDNWISSIDEVEYGKEQWIDIIITDHHKNLETLPDAVAVVNPVVSPEYWCNYLAWVWVAFKLIAALLEKSKFDQDKKNEIFNYFLPIVAIWTVADIMPLLWENRLFIKKWLYLINNHRDKIPKSLQWYLEYLNLRDVDAFHFWFVIWPRINAWWRIDSPYTSLKTLMTYWDKQKEYLAKLDEINSERKKMQEDAFKIAEKNIDLEQKMLIAEHEDFHEWIVWIVSWKITEKYNKPSVVFKLDKEKWLAIWSLRWPEYFNVIEMLQQNADILERFGWHKWAGWLSVKLEKLPELKERIKQYCADKISDDDLEKIVYIDTKFYENERDNEVISKIADLWPFWEWNPEPQFLFENIKVEDIQKVWKNWNGHMKIRWVLWDKKIDFLFRWKWDMVEDVENKKEISIVWKIKKDDFNGWYSVVWVEIL